MALLWRAEFGSGRFSGSPVPTSLVWEKILTAPDSSTLQIQWRGTNLGFCRWTAAVGQEVSTALSTGDEQGPQGLSGGPATPLQAAQRQQLSACLQQARSDSAALFDRLRKEEFDAG